MWAVEHSAHTPTRGYDVRRAPMLGNLTLVLGYLRDARVGGPVGRGLVVERDVDVRVVLNLVKLGRRAVGNEDEIDLLGMYSYS